MAVKESALVNGLAPRFGFDKGMVHTLTAAARNPHLDLNACAIVYRYTGTSEASQDAGMIVACCWAMFHRHYTGPVNAAGVNLGAAMRRLPGSDQDRHFTALSYATRKSLKEHLVTAVQALAAARSVPDWHMLHRDVFWMLDGDPRRVLRRWAAGLYFQPPVTATATATAAETVEEITA